MKGRTLVVLAVFIGLLGGLLLLKYIQGTEIVQLRIDIPALRVDDAISEDVPEDAVGPPDRIEIKRKGGQVVIERIEGVWEIIQPIESLAKEHRVKAMLRAFEEETKSSLGREVEVDQLGDYGLSDKRRIHVTLVEEGEVIVDLWLGSAIRIDDQGTMDTNVMKPFTEEVFRVRGRDLRKPFDVELDDLQDKKIFRFKKDEVTRLVIKDPRDEEHPEQVLVRTRDGGRDGWVLEGFDRFKVMDLGTLCSTLASLTATRIAPSLPGAEAEALDKTYRVEITTGTGDAEVVHGLELGAGRGAVWGKVDGRRGVIQISTTTADAIMKTRQELRDKRLFGFKKEEILRIDLNSPLAKEFLVLLKADDAWYFEDNHKSAARAEANRIAAAISALRSQEYVKRGLEGTGLEDPAHIVKISIDVGGEQVTHTLKIGGKVEGKDESDPERYWAQLDEGEELIQLADYSVKSMIKTREELRDKRIFLIDPSKVTAVQYVYPDARFKVVRQGDRWTVAGDEEKNIDPASVDAIIQTLTDLQVKAVKPDITPEDARLSLTITVTMGESFETSLRLSEEVVDGGNYAQAPKNSSFGDMIVTVSQYKAANLLKRLTDLEKKQ